MGPKLGYGLFQFRSFSFRCRRCRSLPEKSRWLLCAASHLGMLKTINEKIFWWLNGPQISNIMNFECVDAVWQSQSLSSELWRFNHFQTEFSTALKFCAKPHDFRMLHSHCLDTWPLLIKDILFTHIHAHQTQHFTVHSNKFHDWFCLSDAWWQLDQTIELLCWQTFQNF